MSGDREGLGRRIEELRVDAGLTSRQLDALAGLRACHSRQIETGGVPNVTVDTLRKIAGVFNCSTDWIISGEGRRPSKRALGIAVERAKARVTDPGRTGTTD